MAGNAQMKRTISEQYELARKVMPGGVNSSTRLNSAIGVPLYVSKAKGDTLYDLEGKPYIDMCCAHGAGLLGNAHPALVAAIQKSVEMGVCTAMETEYHEELARRVTEAIPCADMVRFVNAGSEATMHLIRCCRGFTGRKKIIRMEGHFHGYHESIYIGGQVPEDKLATNYEHPYPESKGIPEEFASLIVPIPFNDVEAFDRAVAEHGKDTACVILEPVCYNTGGMIPLPGYLEHIREVTRREGILLFFDEVQSAFKCSPGGAQQDFGVTPDVSTFGKSVGGGLPLSGMCGRKDVMESFKPVGAVQHSGTFNAPLPNILGGLAFMDQVENPDFYPTLEKLSDHFFGGVDKIVRENGLNLVVTHHGPRFNIVLGRKTAPVRYEDTFTHKRESMKAFIRGCFEQGVYFHDYGSGPSHHGFSIAHTEQSLDFVLNVMKNTFVTMHAEGLV